MKFVKEQTLVIDKAVSSFCKSVENYADELSSEYTSNNTKENLQQFENHIAVKFIKEIDSMVVVSNPIYNNGFDKNKGLYSDDFFNAGFNWLKNGLDSINPFELIYQYHRDSSQQIVFFVNEDFLKESISNLLVADYSQPLLFDSAKQQLLFSTDYQLSEIEIVDGDSISENLNISLLNKLTSNNKRPLLFATFNDDLNAYIGIFQKPGAYDLVSQGFLFLIILVLVFIFLLGIIQILVTNKRQTRSIRNLVHYVSVNVGQGITIKGNESILLRKQFEKLHNQLEIIEKNQEKVNQKNSKLENDLKLAKKLQRNLMPTITPKLTGRKEFDLYALSEPAFDIGGDLVDYFFIDDNHLLLAIGDVAGKGIPASLYMIYTHTLLRNISKSGSEVPFIMEHLNNRLIEENISDMFVTFFLGILDINTGLLNYCNAAHNLPLIIYSDGRIEELSDIHGIPLGIYQNRNYKYSTIQLNAKDQLFIYSDGVTDSVDENGMKYSLDVLKYNLMGSWLDQPQNIGVKIKNSIDEFRGNQSPEDDVSILIIQYMPDKGKKVTD
ncbi:MAG: serine/threonine-protein phosphatase [Prolixibacteraceae bacterium]|nr:serine/threonine-protein phosphatase [Prolixibacteraceae bacterium]